MSDRYQVLEQEVEERVKELLGDSRPVYAVVDTKTGRVVPFGGYGHSKKRAEQRAKRENEKRETYGK